MAQWDDDDSAFASPPPLPLAPRPSPHLLPPPLPSARRAVQEAQQRPPLWSDAAHRFLLGDGGREVGGRRRLSGVTADGDGEAARPRRGRPKQRRTPAQPKRAKSTPSTPLPLDPLQLRLSSSTLPTSRGSAARPKRSRADAQSQRSTASLHQPLLRASRRHYHPHHQPRAVGRLSASDGSDDAKEGEGLGSGEEGAEVGRWGGVDERRLRSLRVDLHSLDCDIRRLQMDRQRLHSLLTSIPVDHLSQAPAAAQSAAPPAPLPSPPAHNPRASSSAPSRPSVPSSTRRSLQWRRHSLRICRRPLTISDPPVSSAPSTSSPSSLPAPAPSLAVCECGEVSWWLLSSSGRPLPALPHLPFLTGVPTHNHGTHSHQRSSSGPVGAIAGTTALQCQSSPQLQSLSAPTASTCATAGQGSEEEARRRRVEGKVDVQSMEPPGGGKPTPPSMASPVGCGAALLSPHVTSTTTTQRSSARCLPSSPSDPSPSSSASPFDPLVAPSLGWSWHSPLPPLFPSSPLPLHQPHDRFPSTPLPVLPCRRHLRCPPPLCLHSLPAQQRPHLNPCSSNARARSPAPSSSTALPSSAACRWTVMKRQGGSSERWWSPMPSPASRPLLLSPAVGLRWIERRLCWLCGTTRPTGGWSARSAALAPAQEPRPTLPCHLQLSSSTMMWPTAAPTMAAAQYLLVMALSAGSLLRVARSRSHSSRCRCRCRCSSSSSWRIPAQPQRGPARAPPKRLRTASPLAPLLCSPASPQRRPPGSPAPPTPALSPRLSPASTSSFRAAQHVTSARRGTASLTASDTLQAAAASSSSPTPPPARRSSSSLSSSHRPSPASSASAPAPAPASVTASASPLLRSLSSLPPAAGARSHGHGAHLLHLPPSAVRAPVSSTSPSPAGSLIPLPSTMAALSFSALVTAFTEAFPPPSSSAPTSLPLFSTCATVDLQRWMRECGLKSNKSHQHCAHKLSACFTGLQQQQQKLHSMAAENSQQSRAPLPRQEGIFKVGSVAVGASSVSSDALAPLFSSTVPISPSSSSWPNLCGQLRDFLRSEASVYLQLLLLQPLDLNSLLLCVQGAGMECNRDQLTAFLDMEGVPFAQTPHNPQHNRSRQKKQKSSHDFH